VEQQPHFDPPQPKVGAGRLEGALGFVKKLGLVLMAGLLGATLYFLIFGPRNVIGFVDGLFIVGAILLMISLLPFMAEMFGRTTLPFRLKGRRFEDAVAEERERFRQGETTTLLFSTGGMILVALSFIIGFSVK
jgi:uncharacterized membrane protein